MFLAYDGKETSEEIFKEAEEAYKKNREKFEKEFNLKNTIFKGDNFSVLATLLNGGMKGKIDLIYIDPPFATDSDFTYEEGRVRTISSSKKAKVAYSDTLKDEAFLEFLRKRLLLLRELLSEKGSIYLHIDYKVGHYVKIIMDEVFGAENFLNDISRIKSNPKNFGRRAYGNQKDMILFYAKKRGKNIFNNITTPFTDEELKQKFKKVDPDGRRYNTVPVHAPGESSGITGQKWKGMEPPAGRHWRTSPEKLSELDAEGKIEWSKTGNPRLKKYADESKLKGKKMQDIWTSYKDPSRPTYPTEKNYDMLKMIVEQSSNRGSWVLDAFGGSGTTGKAAAELGRKFILIDQSDIAIKLEREFFESDLLESTDFVDLS